MPPVLPRAVRPALLALTCVLAACAGGPPLPAAPTLQAQAPAAWRAPLPHGGQPQALADWWRRFDDPALVRIVEAAQAASPTLAQARSRIAAARLERTSAQSALLPRVDVTASASRGVTNPLFPTPATTVQGGLQASWELDVLGRLGAARTAAGERLQGASAGWHEARVSVAAEAANAWFSLRTCAAQEAVARADAQSRAETARLAGLAARAGLQAPADAALADASAADGAMRLAQQQARCATERKALVALTALDEPVLQGWLADTARPLPAPPAIDAMPLPLLAQRPDVYAAEREVVAAAADVGQADLQRWPRVTLAGSVQRGRFSYGGNDSALRTWSAGPLAVTMPLLDGGVIAANRDAARVRYDEAVLAWQARVRQAVREVEEALVALDSTQERAGQAERAVAGFQVALDAAQARWRSGLGSLVELEDQRRQALAARSALVGLQQERAAALVALYRATGGGWSAQDLQAAVPPLPETR